MRNAYACLFFACVLLLLFCGDRLPIDQLESYLCISAHMRALLKHWAHRPTIAPAMPPVPVVCFHFVGALASIYYLFGVDVGNFGPESRDRRWWW